MALQEMPLRSPQPQHVTHGRREALLQGPRVPITTLQSSEDPGWLTQLWLLSSIPERTVRCSEEK